MSQRLSVFFLMAFISGFPGIALALPHTVFAMQAGSADVALPDGTVPQAVITLILSNSDTACADWRGQRFQADKRYLLTRLSASPTGAGLSGCYEMAERRTDNGECSTSRGRLDGLEFVGAAGGDGSGAVKSARFITGGHIKIDKVMSGRDGATRLTGFASILLGDVATGGIIDAELCPATHAPEQS